jgi:hypothetical protein
MDSHDYTDLRTLSDQDLYTLFANADDDDDHEAALSASLEIARRCKMPVQVTHSVPKWLLWLPRGIWHTKPSGGGG